MASQQDIVKRIRGAKSTGKITRAMEMISAVKMRKAIEGVVAIRPYAHATLAVLRQVSQALGGVHPLLSSRSVKAVLYVVMTSNRGLAGGFNSQVLKRVRALLEDAPDQEALFITLGRKGENGIRRLQGNIVASFPDAVADPDPEKMRAITRVILEEFTSGRVDRVVLVSTDFVSIMAQNAKARAILPVTLAEAEQALEEYAPEVSGEDEVSQTAEYLFEPSPRAVLESMLPRLIEIELLHALLESKASEESARMLAMRNATDAANDMVSAYTLTYNQLRQQKITQEIAELSAGMAAVGS